MPSKRDVLAELSRDELVEAADTFGVELQDRRSKDIAAEALGRSKRAALADILSRLSRDRLKDVCRALELDDAGREKSLLVERIVSGGRAAPAESSNEEDGGDGAGSLVLTSPEPKPAKTVTGAKVKASAPRSPNAISDAAQVLSYRHADRRKNNPEVGMVDPDTDPAQPKTKWAYDPHLDPALQFDVGRSQVEKLIDDALASGDQTVMRQVSSAPAESIRKYSPVVALSTT